MFKKTLLAVSLSTMVMGGAEAAQVLSNDTSNLAIGGRVKANLNSVNTATDTEKTKKKSTLDGSARLNISGSTNISGDIKAIIFAEWDIAARTSQNKKFNAREVYLGVDGGYYGKLTFGQQHSGINKATNRADVYTDWGNEASVYWNSDLRGIGGYQEGQIKYALEANGFNFDVSYQTAAEKNVDSGVSAAMGYTLDLCGSGPLFGVVGFDYYKYSDDFKATRFGKDTSSVAAGVSYGVLGDGLYAGLTYQHTKMSNTGDFRDYQINSVETAIGYEFENSLYGIVGYEHAHLNGADNELVSHVNLEAGYNFADNFKVYSIAVLGSEKIINGRGYGKADKQFDRFTVGLIYEF